MSKELSKVAKSLIVLLNNINELVVVSSNRSEAVDVMKALRVYAKEKGFDVPQDKIENFLSTILDSRPATVQYLLQDIADDIITLDGKRTS